MSGSSREEDSVFFLLKFGKLRLFACDDWKKGVNSSEHQEEETKQFDMGTARHFPLFGRRRGTKIKQFLSCFWNCGTFPWEPREPRFPNITDWKKKDNFPHRQRGAKSISFPLFCWGNKAGNLGQGIWISCLRRNGKTRAVVGGGQKGVGVWGMYRNMKVWWTGGSGATIYQLRKIPMQYKQKELCKTTFGILVGQRHCQYRVQYNDADFKIKTSFDSFETPNAVPVRKTTAST